MAGLRTVMMLLMQLIFRFGNTHKPPEGKQHPFPETTQRFLETKGHSTEATQRPTDTTQRPTETIQGPNEITQRATETTQCPTETTQCPTETTQRATETTQCPTETTQHPSETTQRPTETSQHPSETTQRPTETSQHPSETTQRPTETTQGPTETMQRATETTQNPETMQRPTETTQNPETMQRPTETTQNPETMQRPTEATQRPTETTQRPTETTQRPTETTQRPTETTQRATETTQRPTEATQRPTETTQRPTETTQRPIEITQRPTETMQRPTETTRRSTEITQRPTETVQRPTEATQRPTEATQRPTETTRRSTETTQRPTETVQRPSETTQRPTETTQHPTKATRLSTETMLRPTETMRRSTKRRWRWRPTKITWRPTSTPKDMLTTTTIKESDSGPYPYQLLFNTPEMAACFLFSVATFHEVYKVIHPARHTVAVNFSLSLIDQTRQLGHSSYSSQGFNEERVYSCPLRIDAPLDSPLVVEIVENTLSEVLFKDGYHVTTRVDQQREADAFTSIKGIVFVNPYGRFKMTLIETSDNTDAIDRFEAKFYKVEKGGIHSKTLAPNTGYFETPLYSIQRRYFPEGEDRFAHIAVPPGHVTMVSFANTTLISCILLYAPRDLRSTKFLHIFYDSYMDLDNDTELLNVCNTDRLLTTVVSTINRRFLFIRFSEKRLLALAKKMSLEIIGFRMYFSFHNQSYSPHKLADGIWNCSVPHLSDFRFHLSCNFDAECQNAEDETNCSYTSGDCGSGYLSVGDACFFYIRRREELLSWTDANRICILRGGLLAKLDSAEKWRHVTGNLISSSWTNLKMFIGLCSTSPSLPLWYKTVTQWADGTIAFYHPYIVNHTKVEGCSGGHSCSVLTHVSGRPAINYGPFCKRTMPANIICEKPVSWTQSIVLPKPQNQTPSISSMTCPAGHFTHEFLACDLKSACWLPGSSKLCRSTGMTRSSSFSCSNSMMSIPYTLVCDHRLDCSDGSDEDFCSFPQCPDTYFTCGDKQCVSNLIVCNGWEDCASGLDERDCEATVLLNWVLPPPAVVYINQSGQFSVRPFVDHHGEGPADGNSSTDPSGGPLCPDTHFRCPNNGYCLPVMLRCNGVYDCSGHEDEADCDSYTCPGFYRCRHSSVCLPPSDLCDGHTHCPQHDDELLCDLSCPQGCQCLGLAFFCPQRFNALLYPNIRFLDASGTTMASHDLTNHLLLIYLILANCHITSIRFLNLPNLLTMDASDNIISIISPHSLIGVPQLRELILAGNPLVNVLDGVVSLSSSTHLVVLDLSRLVIRDLNVSVLSKVFPRLQVLNLSHSGVQHIVGDGFQTIRDLRVLDLRGCPVERFPDVMFQGLNLLQIVYASNFKVCCPGVRPANFSSLNCLTPSSSISCARLLQDTVYIGFVYVFALLAIFGNLANFVSRTLCVQPGEKMSVDAFVTHLSISDFLKGIYLAIIAVADRVYTGTYIWNDLVWIKSSACSVAGVVSLLSSEVSTFIMFLLTLDRYLFVRFPFSKQHFSFTTAHKAAATVWMLGLTVVLVPLLPVAGHWEFYSQSAVCLPLPVSGDDFAGYDYAFSIVIVLNFVLYIFISIGQLSIYTIVRTDLTSLSTPMAKVQDARIARRLFAVVLTNSLCWLPVCFLGLLAANGMAVPSNARWVVALIILPLTSAFNPVLYSWIVLLEQKSQAREERVRNILLAQVKKK